MNKLTKWFGIGALSLASLASGCVDRYPKESEERGEINLNVLNQLPAYSFVKSDFFSGSAVPVNQNFKYLFKQGLIEDGKYKDILRLGQEEGEYFRALEFIDYGQDGIVELLISRTPNFLADTLDLSERADIDLDRQKNVSRQYQNLVEEINFPFMEMVNLK